jgi:DNA-binding CsgD family transcriptional regulator
VTLIGRPTELDAIEGVVDAARGGHSGVLVLRGPAGIGKTALLEHAVAVASDVRVLRAEGVEAESELAFAGLHQLLWPLRDAPPLEPLFRLDSTGVADRFAVAAGTLGVLAEAADEQPVLCAVDDVQWLDRPSAEALGFVARRLGAEPIAVIAAIRDPAPLPAGLARCPQLVLGGLPPEAARRLLGEELAPADRERVLEAADGNPLALLELPRGPLGSGGEMNSLERSFADRIAALPADARDAIVVAAADDDPGGATALRALAAIGDLASAEAGGLLWVDGGRIAFRHPLVRSAAYGLATFDERRRAHAALAEALTSPADADRRAWHRAAAAAAPDADVAAELDRSAERARARGGHAAAGAALERAARLTDDDPLRARRLVAAAESARLAGDAVHAEGLAAEALALGDPGTVAEATAIRGAVRVHAGAVADGERDLRAAASVLEAAQPRRALRIGLLAAEAAAIDGRHEHASDVGRWTSSLAVGDDPAERALVAFASAIGNLFSGATAAARANVTEACVLAPRSRDPQALIWAGIGAVYVGDIAAARCAFADAVAGARERGAVGAVAYAMQLAAYVELLDGRFALAGTDAAESLALAEEAGDDAAVSHCRAMLAWRAAVRGDVDDAEALAAQALAWAGARPQSVAAESAGRALALADLGASRFDAALDRLLALRAHPGRRMLAVGDLVEAAVGCGRADAAREPLAALEAWTAATGSAWGAATVAGAAVQLAADAEAAEAAYAAAVAAHEEIALPFDRARVELRLGEHLRRARRRVDARRHLRAALDLFAHTGAAPWEQRAAAELRATGETARRRDASTLDDLTPQELQIARLAAEGATNRDIAARLFLSPRTVEYHLRKVFQKLGVTSRTQLAGLDW